ncbi:MAG: hypothetical protein RSC12_06095 [Alistipes sp.]
MKEFLENSELPYIVSKEQLEELRDRIRRSTTRQPEGIRTRPLSGRITWAAAAVAVVAVGVLFVGQRYLHPAPEPVDFEQQLSQTSADVLHQAAENNYDDIIFSQQL